MPNKKFTRRKNFEIYKQVIGLRKKEFSYSEIRKETGIAKSTINNWLTYAGLTLSREHFDIQSKNRIEGHIIGTAASKITREKRKEIEIQNFISDAKSYFNDPFFIAGVMLYQAEGTKGDTNSFSNSDFRLISIYMKFLEKYFFLSRHINMHFRLYIHETRKDDLERIKNHWSKKLLISPDKFRISWKHNIVTKQRFNLDYTGQLSINVCGMSHFTRKLLTISDIILSKYQRLS